MKLASYLRFDKVEEMLLQQLGETFQIIQAKEEFSHLSRRTKVLIARKYLWSIINIYIKEDWKTNLMNTEGIGLLSVLKDYQQKEMKFNAEGKELSFKFDFTSENSTAGFSFGSSLKSSSSDTATNIEATSTNSIAGFPFGSSSKPLSSNTATN